MLDFEQQSNQAQALASLDEDWHLLEGECNWARPWQFFYPLAWAPSNAGDERSGVDG